MMDMRWKCSWCGARYTTDEYIFDLLQVPAVEDEADPPPHGYIAVCRCGKAFHRDTWRLHDYIDGPDGVRYFVFTVHLELNFGFLGPALWYETVVCTPDGHWCDFCDRYTTQAQAEAGHILVMDMVRTGAIAYTAKSEEGQV